MQIINPMWVTNAVYKVIRSHLLGKNAILTRENFREIFANDNSYKERHYEWIIDLLNKFEISFTIDKSKILIPSKLDANQPDFDLNFYQRGLNFLYEYESILKKSVISQFTVKMSRYIDNSKTPPYWQRGVFLEYGDSKAVVISDEDKKIISISINTNSLLGREFLSIIRHSLREINSKTLMANELIPLILDSKNVGFEDYDYLIDLEMQNIKESSLKAEIDGKKRSHKFDIKELLDGYRFKNVKGFGYEKLKNDLIEIAMIESENRNAIFKESEDEINDRFRNALLHRKYSANDQSRGGDSENGKSAGERDIVIRDKRIGVAESVIEALILKSFDKKSIDKHYNKLCKRYDTLGNRANFMLIYSKADDFDSLWVKYKNHFYDFQDRSDIDSQKENIRVGVTKDFNMSLFHIFINFCSRK